MKIGIISDVHGNYLALDSVLTFLKKEIFVDSIYFLGDAVGYIPDGNRVIERLKNDNISCLMGNHEAMLLNIIPVKSELEKIYRLTYEQITSKNLKYIKQLMPFKEMSIDNQRILMVHGSPFNPLQGYIYPDHNFSILPTLDYKYIFMGHTHRPFIKKVENTTWVNVGSCGLPRDAGDLASFAVFDSQLESVCIYRKKFDLSGTLKIYKEHIHNEVIDCFMRPYDVSSIVGKII
jgi:putative phosphoesterase